MAFEGMPYAKAWQSATPHGDSPVSPPQVSTWVVSCSQQRKNLPVLEFFQIFWMIPKIVYFYGFWADFYLGT